MRNSDAGGWKGGPMGGTSKVPPEPGACNSFAAGVNCWLALASLPGLVCEGRSDWGWPGKPPTGDCRKADGVNAGKTGATPRGADLFTANRSSIGILLDGISEQVPGYRPCISAIRSTSR